MQTFSRFDRASENSDFTPNIMLKIKPITLKMCMHISFLNLAETSLNTNKKFGRTSYRNTYISNFKGH